MVLERILDCFFLGRKDGDEKVLPMVERVGEQREDLLKIYVCT